MDKEERLSVKFYVGVIALLLFVVVMLIVAILSEADKNKPRNLFQQTPTEEQKELVHKTFSKEAAGDPHRRFGFEVLSCQKRLKDFSNFGEITLYLVGEVKNISSKPLDVELQGLVRDENRRVVASERFCVGCTTNIVPGDSCTFERIFSFPTVNGYSIRKVQNFMVDIKILSSQTRY